MSREIRQAGRHTGTDTGSLWRVAAPPALLVGALLLVTIGRYGPHGDELYFRMLPPRWWYEDQPPLTVWLAWAARQVSDSWWVQRLPAVVAAMAGCIVAAAFPRLLGHGEAAQRFAAWAHAFAVYPLLMGHVMLTSTLDLLAWQVVILLVLAATLGRRQALVAAGVVAGVAAWNKLLVLVLVAALVVALLLVDPRLLRTREAMWAALAVLVGAGPQVAAQVLHGLPMAQVSADLVARQGETVRWVTLPLLAVFLGPPLLAVWWRGLVGPWRGDDPRGRVLLPTAVLVLAWSLAAPGQPYYAVGAFIPALALGWGAILRSSAALTRARRVVTANSVVAVVVCLPLLPATDWWLRAASVVNPTVADQVDRPGEVRRLAAMSPGTSAVVTTTYDVAGSIDLYGATYGLTEVASGHNALWRMGPPRETTVLLVGSIVTTHRELFRRCTDLGVLEPLMPMTVATRRTPQPVAVCEEPVGGWASAWPQFRRLAG